MTTPTCRSWLFAASLLAMACGEEATDVSNDTDAASLSDYPVDCVYTPFYYGDTCSEPCGGGVLVGQRVVAQEAANGGAACEGELVIEDTCNTQACPSLEEVHTVGFNGGAFMNLMRDVWVETDHSLPSDLVELARDDNEVELVSDAMRYVRLDLNADMVMETHPDSGWVWPARGSILSINPAELNGWAVTRISLGDSGAFVQMSADSWYKNEASGTTEWFTLHRGPDHVSLIQVSSFVDASIRLSNKELTSTDLNGGTDPVTTNYVSHNPTELNGWMVRQVEFDGGSITQVSPDTWRTVGLLPGEPVVMTQRARDASSIVMSVSAQSDHYEIDTRTDQVRLTPFGGSGSVPVKTITKSW